MGEEVASALVQGATGILGSFGGGLINSATSSKAAQQMIDFAREQREYNSPKNQRKRLEEAGFNPMTYGQTGQVASAGGVPQITPDHSLGEAVSRSGMYIGQTLNDTINRQNVSANIEKTRQDTLNSIDEQRRKWVETYDKQETNSLARKLAKKNLEWLDREKDVLLRRNESEISLNNARENLEREHLVTEHIDQQIKRLQIPIAQSQIAVNYAQVKSALASAYAAFQQGNFAKAQKIYTESLTQTENDLRSAKVTHQKAQANYMDVVYQSALSELLWNRQPAFDDKSPFNNPSQWSNKDVLRFMDLLGKGKSIINPLEGFDAGALLMQFMPK